MKKAPIKVWFVGRVLGMLRNLGNSCVKYSNPIDLMDRQSNMEIDLCWYRQGTNNKWTYNLTNHLIVDLKTKIALASMTYTINFDGCIRHLGDGIFFNEFNNECYCSTLYI